MRPGTSALVNSGFDPATALRAWPETGYQAPMAATCPEAGREGGPARPVAVGDAQRLLASGGGRGRRRGGGRLVGGVRALGSHEREGDSEDGEGSDQFATDRVHRDLLVDVQARPGLFM